MLSFHQLALQNVAPHFSFKASHNNVFMHRLMLFQKTDQINWLNCPMGKLACFVWSSIPIPQCSLSPCGKPAVATGHHRNRQCNWDKEHLYFVCTRTTALGRVPIKVCWLESQSMSTSQTAQHLLLSVQINKSYAGNKTTCLFSPVSARTIVKNNDSDPSESSSF